MVTLAIITQTPVKKEGMLHHIPVFSLVIALLVSLYSSPIYADDDGGGKIQALCRNVNMKSWGSQEKMLKKVEAMGFKPFKIKVEKGCWQVDALNQDKQKVEIYIDPVSGETVMRKVKKDPVVIPPSP